jgi:hypothetical protein
MSYKLIFEFNSKQELFEHINHMCDLEIMDSLVKQKENPIFDNRGSHIKNLHEKTKQYQLEHPEIKYHQAMKLVSKLDKQPIIEAP